MADVGRRSVICGLGLLRAGRDSRRPEGLTVWDGLWFCAPWPSRTHGLTLPALGVRDGLSCVFTPRKAPGLFLQLQLDRER